MDAARPAKRWCPTTTLHGTTTRKSQLLKAVCYVWILLHVVTGRLRLLEGWRTFELYRNGLCIVRRTVAVLALVTFYLCTVRFIFIMCECEHLLDLLWAAYVLRILVLKSKIRDIITPSRRMWSVRVCLQANELRSIIVRLLWKFCTHVTSLTLVN
jgi:hypothetical protein